MSTILKLLGSNSKTKGTKIGLLATAATTGITVAKFFGKRSIWGIVGGIGVSLAADYIQKKYNKKLEANVDQNLPNKVEYQDVK